METAFTSHEGLLEAHAGQSTAWRATVTAGTECSAAYLTAVFARALRLPIEAAAAMAAAVELGGRIVVSSGAREHVEADVLQLNGAGVNARLEHAS